MKLTQKLLGLLHRVFDTDPDQFLALRINSNSGALTWAVSDAVLTTDVAGQPDRNLKINLVDYTIRELIDYLVGQPGYVVLSTASSEQMSLSARTLIDATGDVRKSNGDHLYAYTSLNWAFLEPAAVELRAAKAQIPNALAQMSIPTASDDWIDELGNLYGVPRLTNELDSSYAPRVIAEVVRPRSNNVAIEAAISFYTGQPTKVTDVVIYGAAFPLYNGAVLRNSQYLYQNSPSPRYGLFDVEFGYDLLSGTDQNDFSLKVRSIVEKLRAAGTQMRALQLKAGSIIDYVPAPTDDFGSFSVKPVLVDTAPKPTEDMVLRSSITFGNIDPVPVPTEETAITIVYDYRYNSVRRRDSKINYMGGRTTLNDVIIENVNQVPDGALVYNGSYVMLNGDYVLGR